MMYPSNSPYNPWRSYEQATANAEPTPEGRAVGGLWSGRFSIIFAVATIAVTVVAIALAALAPSLVARPDTTPPAGFTQVYDANLSDDGKWPNQSPCTLTSQGLDVAGGTDGTACLFRPSASADLTSQGFWFQATVAPAASVAGSMEPVILIGDTEAIFFEQQGAYAVVCADSSTGTARVCAEGTTTAWHTNAFVANTITVSYDAGASLLTLFANDQRVTSVTLTVGSQASLALGAGSDSEVLFTHATIFTGGGNARAAGSTWVDRSS